MAAWERERHGQSGGWRATSTVQGKCGGESVCEGEEAPERGGGQAGKLAGNQGVYDGEDFLGFFVLPTVTLDACPSPPLHHPA